MVGARIFLLLMLSTHMVHAMFVRSRPDVCQTQLNCAITLGDMAHVKRLIEDQGARADYSLVMDPEIPTPLYVSLYELMCNAQEYMYPSALIESRAKKENSRAKMVESEKIVTYLLEKKASLTINTHYKGMSPLYMACACAGEYIFPHIVQLLLDYDADPNGANDYSIHTDNTDEYKPGFTPLIGSIVNHKKTNVAELLLKNRADPNQPAQGKSPLYFAQKKYVFVPSQRAFFNQFVSLLLKYGANKNQALWHAIDNQDLQSVIELVEQKDANVHYPIKTYTPLIQSLLQAYYTNNKTKASTAYSIMCYLLSQGADVNEYGPTATPLYYALSIQPQMSTFRKIIVNTLLVYKADPNKECLLSDYSHYSNNAHTPGASLALMVALENNIETKVIKLLLNYNADPTVLDPARGLTPLQGAYNMPGQERYPLLLSWTPKKPASIQEEKYEPPF